MGDDNRRPAPHHLLVSFGNLALRFGVERGRRFVEDQDRRVHQERAGNGDPLPLAGGQRHAPLADNCLELLRQPLDEGCERGAPRGFRTSASDASGRA